MKKCGFLIGLTFIITSFMLSSCAPFTVTLPENARVKGAAWVADDILAYYAEDGVHIWNAESGEGKVLTVSDTFDTDKSAEFAISPDNRKLSVIIRSIRNGIYCSVFDLHSGEKVRQLELKDSLGERYRISQDRYEVGFFDNDTLYIGNRFRLMFIDLDTGQELQITEDPTDFLEDLTKEQLDYFEWVYAPVVVGDKIYYNGMRNSDFKSRIYCADQNGEIELGFEGSTGILAAVPGMGFVYAADDQNGNRQVRYYDLETTASDLVSDGVSQDIIVQDGKIGYTSNVAVSNDFTAFLYDIHTKQTLTAPIYSASRDFPQEDYHQFNGLCGFVPDGQGLAFIFKVGHHSNTEYYTVSKTLIYRTLTDQAVEAADFEGFELFDDGISPSGEYMLLIGETDETGNGYSIKAVKTSEYIHPDSTK